MEVHETDTMSGSLFVIEEMMASAVQLPLQNASSSDWSPEKRLAAAVLGVTLVELRERSGEPSYQRNISESVAWIHSEEVEWPFSFLRLCDLFDLDPNWVRSVADNWVRAPKIKRDGSRPRYRQAA